MAGVTDWVQRALAELGPDATVKALTEYVLEKDPSVPQRYISLAMRNLKRRGLSAVGKRSRNKQPHANPSQGTFEFLE